RPAESGDAFFRARDFLCLPTVDAQDMNFGTWAFIARGRSARGQKRDRRAVRRPLRLRLSALAESELARWTRPVRRNEPEVCANVVLVAECRVALGGSGIGMFPPTHGVDDERAV